MATGRYTLFFDADDTIHRDVVPQVLARMDMHPTLDTAILFYSRQKRETSEILGMARIDQDLLLECLGGRDEAMGPPNAMAGLLAMNNFPWNKILRTERFRQAGLKFGKTQVHNDLLGHWHALLHARQVLLMNKTLCTHRVSKSGSNLTSRFNADRLQMFAALSELLDFLEDRPEWSRMYARQFWGLAQRMVDWAGPRLDPDLKTRFDMQYSDLLCRIHLADLARIRTQGSGGLAKRIVNHLIR
ncbi:hypothetical protein GCM10011358_25030 [Sinisalibacter lacisalsi]|uniref:Uncharacterized protein n=2 Tax=Sinisalibacter lacisalsi TaxID=1526570 RepID=A0ABQ1QRH8_9RHOB|nr:hypothetical protein GCM10011358_25030 [Sinisalibacter lacisalsi]